MNQTYLDQERAKLDALRDELRPIAEALGWTLEPPQYSDDGWPVRFAVMTGPDGLQIAAAHPWNDSKRIEFSGHAWPSYTDKNGDQKRCFPSDCSLDAPRTTAAVGRDPAQVARQIKARLIKPYVEIYGTLAERAQAWQKSADDYADACRALRKATGEPPADHNDRPLDPCYVRDLPGFPVRVDMQASDTVDLHSLTTAEAVACIALIREMREERQEAAA